MGFILDIWNHFGVFVMLTVSLNFLVGYAGVMYVGHIAFVALGAYSTAVLCQTFGWFPPLSMVVGMVLSGILAALLGVFAVRLAGHYLLLASLGICEIVRSIANNSQFTGAAEGILVPGKFVSADLGPYQIPMVIALFLGLEILFFHYLIESPHGRLYRATRDDPLLLLTVGKPVNKIKTQALIISGIWAAIAGSLFAHHARYIDPTSFTVMESLMLLIAIMVGGIASLSGSIIAGVIMVILPALTRFVNLPPTLISPMHRIIFAVALLLLLVFRPKGIFGRVVLP